MRAIADIAFAVSMRAASVLCCLFCIQPPIPAVKPNPITSNVMGWRMMSSMALNKSRHTGLRFRAPTSRKRCKPANRETVFGEKCCSGGRVISSPSNGQEVALIKRRAARDSAKNQMRFTQQGDNGPRGFVQADHQVLHKDRDRYRRVAVFKVFEQALNLVGRNFQSHAL